MTTKKYHFTQTKIKLLTLVHESDGAVFWLTWQLFSSRLRYLKNYVSLSEYPKIFRNINSKAFTVNDKDPSIEAKH